MHSVYSVDLFILSVAGSVLRFFLLDMKKQQTLLLLFYHAVQALMWKIYPEL